MDKITKIRLIINTQCGILLLGLVLGEHKHLLIPIILISIILINSIQIFRQLWRSK